MCKHGEVRALHAQIHRKIINIVVENLPDVDIVDWLRSAMPAIVSGGPKTFAETTNARTQNMTDLLQDWEPLDMWKGVVPKQLIDLLEGLGMRRKQRSKAAQGIVSLLEQAATDIWLLTNAAKQKKKPVTPPTATIEE